MLAPVRTVAPTDTPISLAEAKAQCRVDHTDEDALITALVDAATVHLDGYTGILGRAMLEQTWQQDFSGFTDGMRLAVSDLLAVSGVTYYDASNVQQTLSTDVYSAHSDAIGPYLHLNYGQVWPTVYTRPDAVRVTWTAGYGSTVGDVPAPIKHAMKLLVAHWYGNREAVGLGAGITAMEVPMAVNALVAPFRRVQV